MTARNVTLTAAQLRRIRLYTVASSKFRKSIEAAGVVDFDNDQATSVLAPFSGPVSRLLVSAGQTVRDGQALALVDSPDFAAAIGAYGKALATARTARKLADMDKDLVQHNGVSQREAQQAQTDAANAEADRDAALRALVSLRLDPRAIKDIQQGRSMSRIEAAIRSPITGTVVEKLITPGELLQAGVTPSFTVANLSRVWVMAQVSGSDLASVSLGDPAQVESGIGSANFSGTVGNVSALVNPDTRTVVEWFDLGGSLPLSDTSSADEVITETRGVQGIRELAERAGIPGGAPAPAVASAIDFVLEGLYAQKKISRSDERGYSAVEAAAPRRGPRREDVNIDEELRMPTTGKKKYYN